MVDNDGAMRPKHEEETEYGEDRLYEEDEDDDEEKMAPESPDDDTMVPRGSPDEWQNPQNPENTRGERLVP